MSIRNHYHESHFNISPKLQAINLISYNKISERQAYTIYYTHTSNPKETLFHLANCPFHQDRQDMSRCSFKLLQSLKKILCLHFSCTRRRGTFSTITNSEDDKFSFVVKINRIHKRHAADKQICDKDKQAVRRNHRDYRLSLS